jgi:hypothetical protein
MVANCFWPKHVAFFLLQYKYVVDYPPKSHLYLIIQPGWITLRWDRNKTWRIRTSQCSDLNCFVLEVLSSYLGPLTVYSKPNHAVISVTVLTNRCPSLTLSTYIPITQRVAPHTALSSFTRTCCLLKHNGTASNSTVQPHLSGLIGKASDPDMQKIRITGFFFMVCGSVHLQIFNKTTN